METAVCGFMQTGFYYGGMWLKIRIAQQVVMNVFHIGFEENLTKM
jgi:hypothetical protein